VIWFLYFVVIKTIKVLVKKLSRSIFKLKVVHIPMKRSERAFKHRLKLDYFAPVFLITGFLFILVSLSAFDKSLMPGACYSILGVVSLLISFAIWGRRYFIEVEKHKKK
jgi:hypothetical protein